MNYQEEVTKRLLKIKELSQMAADDRDLEEFRGMAFFNEKTVEGDGSEFAYDLQLKDLLSRIFFIPLLKLIQNDTDDAAQFWRLLYRWACERNKTPLEHLSLEDITFIIKKIESKKTKQSDAVLQKFKNFILANEMLDKASPFITSDYVMNNATVPAFLTAEPDLSHFIETYSSILLKSIIFSYGIVQPFAHSAGAYEANGEINNFPSGETIKYFQNHKLVQSDKGIYAHTLKSAKEDLRDTNIYFKEIADVQSNEAIKNTLKHFPHYSDVNQLFDMQWSQRSGMPKNFQIYLLGLTYLEELIAAREKIFFNTSSESLSLDELAYIIGSKNTKTIRNEFFKKDNCLKYFDETKTSIDVDSAAAWVEDPKRKQPIYKSILPDNIDEHTFPDITLDYIMKL